jgi:hypothetical protein
MMTMRIQMIMMPNYNNKCNHMGAVSLPPYVLDVMMSAATRRLYPCAQHASTATDSSATTHRLHQDLLQSLAIPGLYGPDERGFDLHAPRH